MNQPIHDTDLETDKSDDSEKSVWRPVWGVRAVRRILGFQRLGEG